jgi:hypothetical protein
MIKTIEIEYELLDHSGLLSEEDQLVLEAARKATQTAYAPYSNFQVGAAAFRAKKYKSLRLAMTQLESLQWILYRLVECAGSLYLILKIVTKLQLG